MPDWNAWRTINQTITPDQLAESEAKLATLRERVRAGPTTLEEAAAVVGMPAPDLMAALALNELQSRPGAAAIIAGADDAVFIRRSGGDVTMTVPPALAQIFIAGMLQADTTATIAIATPLPAVAGSKESH